MMLRHCLLVLGLSLLVAGCGQESSTGKRSAEAKPGTGAETPADAGADPSTVDRPALADRRIIYEADLDLVVSEFDQIEQAMPRLVSEHGGYLSNVSFRRISGERRSGQWEARIPVERFERFLDAVSKLGVPQHRQQRAQDVTEEYVDLEARIANAQKLEQRILELLETNSGKISDVIEVEQELARVRGELERMQGRLRYLTNRTDLSTVRITATERQEFLPAEAPGFTARVGYAWTNSLSGLKTFAENVVIVIVALVPWGVAIALVALPVVLISRRLRVRAQS